MSSKNLLRARNTATIGDYLIERLEAHGVGHVFGIPGDYVLGFYELLRRSRLQTINMCDEQGAGFAADAYARVKGLGAVCITYCVGGLKVANATAGAFAEKSPVIVISGAPGVKERERNPLLHHKVRDFDTQKKVFEQITVAAAVLDDAQTAFQEIDRVIETVLRFKRPGYIEIPRDMVGVRGHPHYQARVVPEVSDARALKAALADAAEMINGARQPVIIADVELHRFGLQRDLVELARRTNIPVAATLLGKSVIGEQHPFYMGVYEGAMGREEVRRYVEGSDCVILLGAFLTDINLGVFTARLDPARSIYATSEKLSVRHRSYEEAGFRDFLRGLARAKLKRRRAGGWPRPANLAERAAVARGRGSEAAITVRRLFERLNAFLTDTTVVVCDVGEALFGAADLYIHRGTEFLGPAYYASMGFAVPAGIGVQMANPRLRPLVLVGDGAFQMTGMEISTALRYGLSPIVVVLNNRGYGTERPMQDGPYNDVAPWQFHRLPEVLGGGRGFLIRTERELNEALVAATKDVSGVYILEVMLDQNDHSPALQRLTERLAKRIHS